MRADDVCARHAAANMMHHEKLSLTTKKKCQESGDCFQCEFSQKQKHVNVVSISERKFLFTVWGYMQLEHDSASSASVQVVSANHAKVSSDVFHIFGVLFDIQLVHNYFYSSLKSPL